MNSRDRKRRDLAVALTVLVVAAVFAATAMFAASRQQGGVAGAAGSAGERKERGLRVKDGDTLITAGGSHVRLLCVDAPEADQPGGEVAARTLAAIVKNGASVRTRDKDNYGRALAIVYTRKEGDRVAINEEMLRRGHAWVFRRFADDCGLSRRSLCAAEDDARAARRGLWRAENPVPPWRWRQGRTRPPNRFPPCEK